MSGGLRIDPSGETVTVTITSANSGDLLDLFTDINCTVAFTNPSAITTRTTVFCRDTIDALVSLTIGGVEFATTTGDELAYTFSDGGVGSCSPVPSSDLDQATDDRGTYVAQGLPSAVGARTGTFDQRKSLYLPVGASMDAVRARLDAAASGTARGRLTWVGTSIVAGYGAGPGTVDPVALLRAKMNGRYGTNIATGTAFAVNNVPEEPDDARYTYNSAQWTFTGSPRNVAGGGAIQLHRKSGGAGQALTFTSDRAGTVLEIHTFGNSAAFTYNIDGAGAVSASLNGQAARQVITVTGLANTTHSVVITSGAANAFILGFNVRQTYGLEIDNMGYYGAVANDFSPAGGAFYNGWNVLDAHAPDVALLQLGANECIHQADGWTVAGMKTSLNLIVDALQADSHGVVLIVDPPIESGTITNWDTYRSGLYDVADTQAVPLIDLTHAWTSRTNGAALGYYYDQWHPTAPGAAAIADTVFGALVR